MLSHEKVTKSPVEVSYKKLYNRSTHSHTVLTPYHDYRHAKNITNIIYYAKPNTHMRFVFVEQSTVVKITISSWLFYHS